MKAISLYFFLLSISFYCFAQTQTLRGTVTDADSKIPLIGVNVVVMKDSALIAGATTNEDGIYRLENIPVGRFKVKFSYIGYQQQTVSDVIVTSAKEVVLNISLSESVNEINEVVVSAFKPGETKNEMATVSARPFTIEETDRYAGSRGDPARMASNFAGVSGADDSRNDIVIRGNSPSGVLFKLEGVPILNPNHFNIPGTTGSPVTILNNKFLANSDFFTGAFPAEYGNTTAGAFDLYERNGNNEKYEFSAQLGFLGTEALAEGPLSKNHKSSFLATYRYSTLQLFDLLNIDIGTNSVPKYQDAFFRLNFQLKNNASLAFWAMGGLSTVDILVSNQAKPTADLYAQNDRDQYFKSNMGITGLTYSKTFSEKTYMKATLALQGNMVNAHHELVYRHTDAEGNYVLDSLLPILDYTFYETRLSGAWNINHKFNSHWLMKAGINADAIHHNYIDSTRQLDTTSSFYYQYYIRWNDEGKSLLLQPYIQFKYKPSDRLAINFGIHEQYFAVKFLWPGETKTSANSPGIHQFIPLEPRAGIQYNLGHDQLIAFGTGLHSQQQSLYLYFYEPEYPGEQIPVDQWVKRNEAMGMTKAAHFVGSYSKLIAKYYFVKAEAYYQYLYDIPVDVHPSSFSLSNTGIGFSRFFPDTLQNTGVGYNYGTELTVQRFFHQQYFWMITGTLFNSQYKASDGMWRNSDFNTGYILNILGTKEFSLGKEKKNTLGIGAKFTMEGGHWYGPVDTTQSELQGEVVYEDSGRNSQQFPAYLRFDLKFNFKVNSKKLTHEIGLDIVNVFDRKNILTLTYVPNDDDPSRSTIQYSYELGRLPIFYYRIDF